MFFHVIVSLCHMLQNTSSIGSIETTYVQCIFDVSS